MPTGPHLRHAFQHLHGAPERFTIASLSPIHSHGHTPVGAVQGAASLTGRKLGFSALPKDATIKSSWRVKK